jgi:P27 family predicted phage terminase small subunit
MPGPPKLPHELKVLRGTFKQSRESVKNPPVLPQNELDIEPPEGLIGDARDEWIRCAAILQNAGLFKTVDRLSFTVYCQLSAQWWDATRSINKHGLTMKIAAVTRRSRDEHGPIVEKRGETIIENPAVATQLKCADQMRRFLVEFGLTPASRSRIDLGPLKKLSEDKPKSGFAGMA